MVCTSARLLLLCFRGSGSFTALEEVVPVGVFNVWPWGIKGSQREVKI